MMQKIKLLFWVSTLIGLQLSATAQDRRSDSFDVQHYHIQLSIRNLASKQISGYTEIKIQSKRNGLNKVRFDLRGLTVSQILIRNQQLNYTRNGEQIIATLPNSLALNDTATISIAYAGQPQTDPKWGGFFFNGDYAFNMGVGMGSVPHTFGRAWFPCVDNFTDRATYSFSISTDIDYVAACGGILQSEVRQGDSVTWNWSLNQTIPTYLASVAVGKYVFVKYTFQGSHSNYPVWLAAIPADTVKLKNAFVRLNTALQCFENRFGPHQFDRVGYAAVPFNSGAMEHAANIAYPIYAIDGTSNYETLMAHELAHSWWGNLVTCADAPDMWLNEGWASFCEALFLECAYGYNQYIDHLQKVRTTVMLNAPKNDGGWLPVSGVKSENTYGTHVYKKGALVAHSLRVYIGDSAFFAACKSYLQQFSFTHATTENLRNHFQSFTNRNLNDFFNRWVYEPGHVGVHIELTDRNSNTQGEVFETYRISESNRYKGGIHSRLPVVVEIHYRDSVAKLNAELQNGFTNIGINYNRLTNPVWAVTVNQTDGMAFGKLYETARLKNTGSVSMPKSLFSMNVREINDSALLLVEHHWTPPFDRFSLQPEGIRMSGERFWRISGKLPDTFLAWAFFSYDGLETSYLDFDLLERMTTEDSLVLLYRPFGGRWQIHTNHTFQPGATNDRLGRFWVNELQMGEYTFGLKDNSVVGVKEKPAKGLKASYIQILPNPAPDYFIIRSKTELKDATIQVVDRMGRFVITKHMIGKEKRIDCIDLPSGQYNILIQEEGETVIKRLMKQ
jgi:hypothetical protein